MAVRWRIHDDAIILIVALYLTLYNTNFNASSCTHEYLISGAGSRPPIRVTRLGGDSDAFEAQSSFITILLECCNASTGILSCCKSSGILSLHTLHNEHHQIYFCTITCYKWLPLFEEGQAYHSVYRWFKHLKKDGCLVTGYVIMPNHFHALLYLSHSGTSLNKMVGEGKRFMAYDIINGLKRSGKTNLLEELKSGVTLKEKLKGKNHQVFRLSFDARLCHDEKMVEQKLDYIHHNPVRGRWTLVEDFVLYPHSSAGFYELGQMNSNTEIVHYKALEVMPIDFVKQNVNADEASESPPTGG